MQIIDLQETGLRALNKTLHAQSETTNQTAWEIVNPKGAHAIACGLDAPIEVTVKGSTGYYCAGMNQQATVNIHGSAGPGTAENMMSGKVVIDGDASQYAGATGHGGLLVIKGNAASRCGISMKGIDIVVHGNIGHMSAFMAQSGTLVVCGDAGDALGDSCYEARILCAARSNPWARIARKRTCGANIWTCCAIFWRRLDQMQNPKSSPAMARRGSFTISISTMLRPIEGTTDENP